MTAPNSPPPAPPAGAVRTCPHCHTQSYADGTKKCPHCKKKFKKHTVRNVLLGITLVLVLMIAGCAALIGGAANEVLEELNAEQARSAISQTEFDAVAIGTTRAAVKKSLLPAVPQDAQEFVSEGIDLGDGTVIDTSSSCIYYNMEGGSFGDTYQFCFTGAGGNGTLRAKNSY